MVCSECGRERATKSDRPPRGWKRLDGAIYCEACWGARWVLRAATIPVSEILDGTWEEFRAALRESWGAATGATNWMTTELFARDARRGATEETKMPRMARQYLYPAARARFPRLPPQSISALEQAVQAKYRAARYQLIWTCARSLPTARYPQPLPVPNQGWSVAVEEERAEVGVRIAERRWRLRLRGGWRYRRPLDTVRRIADGVAVPGQLDLYEQTSRSDLWSNAGGGIVDTAGLRHLSKVNAPVRFYPAPRIQQRSL